MGRKPIVLAFGLFLVVAVVATIAILTGDEPAPEDSAGPTPLNPAADPTWSTNVDAFTDLSVDVRDGLALVQGNEDGLSLRDPSTGAPRWVVEPGTEVPGGGGVRWRGTVSAPRLITHDGRLAALVADYQCEGCVNEDTHFAPTELGLSLLSGEDGRVVWRTVVVAEERMAQEGPTLGRFVADDRLALVGLRSEGGPNGTEVRTIAYDVDNGAVLWELADAWPLAVAGDVVLTVGYPFIMDGEPGVGGLSAGAVAAVDAANGEALWDLGYDRSELLMVAGDVALVRVVGEGRRHPRGLVVTLDKGQVLDELGYGDLGGCATDGRTLIACPRDGDLWTFQVADGQRRTVSAEVDVDRVDAVASDRIYVTRSGDHHSVDRDGRLVDEDLPGRYIASGADWVLFRNSGSDDTADVRIDGYRLRP